MSSSSNLYRHSAHSKSSETSIDQHTSLPIAELVQVNTRWKLNLDVLLRIMHFATQDVVASLMRTCRPLNQKGAKNLFRSPVTLRTTAQVTSFLHFFLARDERGRERATFRYSLLSELLISIHDPEAQPATSALKHFFAYIAPYIRNFARLVYVILRHSYTPIERS